jgi:hypothetical protein
MNIEQIKNQLKSVDEVNFELQNGTMVPAHFHITEIGVVTKHFIDCGGTIRTEKVANFQLWNANDIDHRLKPEKLLSIIELSEEKLGMPNLEIEVEHQAETIGKYDLDFNGKNFVLVSKHTACLAEDSCGIPKEKLRVNLSTLATGNTCTPGGGCC